MGLRVDRLCAMVERARVALRLDLSSERDYSSYDIRLQWRAGHRHFRGRRFYV